MAASSYNRKATDLMKLMTAGYDVEMNNDDMNNFFVRFHGPPDSLYVGGVWKVKVELPDEYPRKPPIIAFVTPMFHPNIAFVSGKVCLNVLNENWSHESDLNVVFGYYLPALLLEPNVSDPFNPGAADLKKRNEAAYNDKVKEYVDRYAKPRDVGEEPGVDDDDSGGEGAMALGPVEPR